MKKKTLKTYQSPPVDFESPSAKCPECHAVINIEGGEIGDYLECETCFAELTVTSLQPPNVTVVDEEK